GRERVEMAQVGPGDAGPGGPNQSGGGRDRAVGGSPTEHQHLRVAGRVIALDRLDDVGDLVDLGLSQQDHVVVVVRVVGDVAGDVGLLDAADAVFRSGGARDGPGPGQSGRVTQERVEDRVAVVVGAVG